VRTARGKPCGRLSTAQDGLIVRKRNTKYVGLVAGDKSLVRNQFLRKYV